MNTIHRTLRSAWFAYGICLLLGAPALLHAPAALGAASVTRGPYLQSGTPDSIVVRWRTSTATDSRVRFGSAPGNLTASVDSAASTTEHIVTLNGLTPDTRYYYSIGTSTAALAGNSADYSFVTAPPTGTVKPTRIWVLGDSGTANANARSVKDAYLNYTGTRRTDLWLMLGDNAYNSGTDSEYQAAVFDMYPELLRQSVLWPTVGNHDGLSANSTTQSGPYYDIFTLPTAGQAGGLASGTEAYYSFDYANIHFICLESNKVNRAPSGAMLNWLQQDVAATTQRWVIAFWHHPPYSKGSHNSDDEIQSIEMRQNALPILEDAGVDLVLTGHSHSYERSVLLNGHYGTSTTLTPAMIIDGGDGRTGGGGAYKEKHPGATSHVGAVYAVAGSSGSINGGALNHPAMYVSLNVLGSMILDVDNERLDAAFLDNQGTVRDSFSMIKNDDNCPVVSNPDQRDTDGDGLGDACDDDDDNDGLTDSFELSIGTNPLNADSDGDGVTDYDEVNYDGNAAAYTPGADLDPSNPDTDADTLSDGDELRAGSNPLDAASPTQQAVTGDINADGQVNVADILLAQRHVFGIALLNAGQIARGDVYPVGGGDDRVTMPDALLIIRSAWQ